MSKKSISYVIPKSQPLYVREDPVDPPADPVVPPADPAVPPADPVVPPADPVVPPSDASAKAIAEAKKLAADVAARDAELAELRGTLESLQSGLGVTLAELGVESVEQLEQTRADRERQDLEKKGEYDRIVEQIREKSKTTETKLNGDLTSLQEQLAAANAQLEELTIGRSFSDSKFIAEESAIPLSIARNLFLGHFERTENGIVAYDKPAGVKDRTPLVDADGKHLSFDAAIGELYTKHPDNKALIKSKMKPGPGSRTTETINTPDLDNTEVRGHSRILSALNSKK